MALAQAKYDLEKFITPGSFEDASKMLSGSGPQMPMGLQPTFQRGGVMVPPTAPPMQTSMAPAMPNTGLQQNPFEQGNNPMQASRPPIPPPVPQQ
jgi:hypothetical protein